MLPTMTNFSSTLFYVSFLVGNFNSPPYLKEHRVGGSWRDELRGGRPRDRPRVRIQGLRRERSRDECCPNAHHAYQNTERDW